uniref:Uncharacterized protein n=1 Tax=Otarine gammaherpesvirus 4 TaxID=2801541 RepID=A0A889IW34_9GAMA|nr:hypothetical protein [Otarine gammaherpesvirus 4]
MLIWAYRNNGIPTTYAPWVTGIIVQSLAIVLVSHHHRWRCAIHTIQPVLPILSLWLWLMNLRVSVSQIEYDQLASRNGCNVSGGFGKVVE